METMRPLIIPHVSGLVFSVAAGGVEEKNLLISVSYE